MKLKLEQGRFGGIIFLCQWCVNPKRTQLRSLFSGKENHPENSGSYPGSGSGGGRRCFHCCWGGFERGSKFSIRERESTWCWKLCQRAQSDDRSWSHFGSECSSILQLTQKTHRFLSPWDFDPGNHPRNLNGEGLKMHLLHGHQKYITIYLSNIGSPKRPWTFLPRCFGDEYFDEFPGFKIFHLFQGRKKQISRSYTLAQVVGLGSLWLCWWNMVQSNISWWYPHSLLHRFHVFAGWIAQFAGWTISFCCLNHNIFAGESLFLLVTSPYAGYITISATELAMFVGVSPFPQGGARSRSAAKPSVCPAGVTGKRPKKLRVSPNKWCYDWKNSWMNFNVTGFRWEHLQEPMALTRKKVGFSCNSSNPILGWWFESPKKLGCLIFEVL